MEIILVLLILAAGLAFYFWFRGRPATPEDKLWAECRRQLRMPPEQADKTIERFLERLQERHPGKSREWYLEKILYDLQRDR